MRPPKKTGKGITPHGAVPCSTEIDRPIKKGRRLTGPNRLPAVGPPSTPHGREAGPAATFAKSHTKRGWRPHRLPRRPACGSPLHSPQAGRQSLAATVLEKPFPQSGGRFPTLRGRHPLQKELHRRALTQEICSGARPPPRRLRRRSGPWQPFRRHPRQCVGPQFPHAPPAPPLADNAALSALPLAEPLRFAPSGLT